MDSVIIDLKLTQILLFLDPAKSLSTPLGTSTASGKQFNNILVGHKRFPTVIEL